MVIRFVKHQHPYFLQHISKTVTARQSKLEFTEIWLGAKVSSVSDSACFVLLHRRQHPRYIMGDTLQLCGFKLYHDKAF